MPHTAEAGSVQAVLCSSYGSFPLSPTDGGAEERKRTSKGAAAATRNRDSRRCPGAVTAPHPTPAHSPFLPLLLRLLTGSQPFTSFV